MVKNVFSILNGDNKFWVEIFKLKYSNLNIWDLHQIPNSSGFYKALCKTAKNIRANLCIISCNPSGTDFWREPWLFDVLIDLKPTLLNMQLAIDDLSISYFISEGHINLSTIHNPVGDQIDSTRHAIQ